MKILFLFLLALSGCIRDEETPLSRNTQLIEEEPVSELPPGIVFPDDFGEYQFEDAICTAAWYEYCWPSGGNFWGQRWYRLCWHVERPLFFLIYPRCVQGGITPFEDQIESL